MKLEINTNIIKVVGETQYTYECGIIQEHGDTRCIYLTKIVGLPFVSIKGITFTFVLFALSREAIEDATTSPI